MLPNKVYDVLKWLCLIVAPAAATCIAALSTIWGFEGGKIVATIAAVQTFVGAVIGVSTKNYNKSLEDEDGRG